jgi:hypothetical protein
MLDDFLQTHHLMHSSKGVFWRQFVMGGAEPEAWKYMSVAVPAACIAGPYAPCWCPFRESVSAEELSKIFFYYIQQYMQYIDYIRTVFSSNTEIESSIPTIKYKTLKRCKGTT